MSVRGKYSVRIMVDNFVERYGKDGLRDLVTMLDNGETLNAIGTRFGVSRQRILQWRMAFGKFVKNPVYTPHEYVASMMGSGTAIVLASRESGNGGDDAEQSDTEPA